MQRQKSTAMQTRSGLVPLLCITLSLFVDKKLEAWTVFFTKVLCRVLRGSTRTLPVRCTIQGRRSSLSPMQDRTTPAVFTFCIKRVLKGTFLLDVVVQLYRKLTRASRELLVCVGVACFTNELHGEPTCSLKYVPESCDLVDSAVTSLVHFL